MKIIIFILGLGALYWCAEHIAARIMLRKDERKDYFSRSWWQRFNAGP